MYCLPDLDAAPPEWEVDEVLLLASVSTVLAGSTTLCKYHTSNDVFPLCQMCAHNNYSEKFWWICYSMTTRWEFGHEVEKPKLCTSGWHSTRRMPMTTFMLAWHSTIRTSMTTSMFTWHRTMRTLATTSTERRAHFLGSVVVSSSSSHLHIHVHVCGLFTLILPFYFMLYFRPLFLFLNYMKSTVNLHNSCNEGVDASDDLLLSTGYEPKAHDFYETTVEPLRAAPGLAAVLLQQSLFCGPRLRRLYTRRHAPSSTSSASLSLSTRRLVCQSVVVVNVR